MIKIKTADDWFEGLELYLKHKQCDQTKILDAKICKKCKYRNYPSCTYLITSASDILDREFAYDLVIDYSLSDVDKVMVAKAAMKKKFNGGN